MKNKLLFTFLGVFISLPLFARDFIYEYEGKYLIYTVVNEDAKTVMTKSGYQSPTEGEVPGNYVSGNLIIPSVVKEGDTEYTVVSIGKSGFYGCDGITSVTIPNTVTTIGKNAFIVCSGLKSVALGNSVVTIEEGAFQGCTLLKEMVIGNSVTTIGNVAFWGCSGLTSVTIGNSVSTIGEYAFQGCSSLTSLIIPESVKSLSEGCFYGCTGLTSANIGNSVRSISSDAFYGCTGLTSVSIGSSVKTIGKRTFNGCNQLTSITIPTSVNSIGSEAFDGCTGLTSVYYGADKPISGYANIFCDDTYDKATLFLSEAGEAAGRDIEPWKNFKNIKTYDFSSVEAIYSDIDITTPYEVYTLGGVQTNNTLENLTPGIYVVRQGKTTKKIVVK